MRIFFTSSVENQFTIWVFTPTVHRYLSRRSGHTLWLDLMDLNAWVNSLHEPFCLLDPCSIFVGMVIGIAISPPIYNTFGAMTCYVARFRVAENPILKFAIQLFYISFQIYCLFGILPLLIFHQRNKI